MIHPNSTAIQYIQELFQTVHITDETRRVMKKVLPIVQAAKHRPVNPESIAHQRFCAQQLKKIDTLEREFDFLDFLNEKQFFGTS